MKAFTFNRVSERFRNKLMNSKIKVTWTSIINEFIWLREKDRNDFKYS